MNDDWIRRFSFMVHAPLWVPAKRDIDSKLAVHADTRHDYCIVMDDFKG
jgi:hypothetical protein